MSRTAEIGRAVLNSTTSPLQLWLTTLITISPQNSATNLEQFKQSELLESLMSGEFWVCRANGMHIVLELTVQGETLDAEEREQLARGILNAPAWTQLHLRPSLPVNEVGENVWPIDGREIRIDINHSRTEDYRAQNKTHRMGANVPFADVRPPDGVPVLGLQSVHFAMDFLRTRPRPKSARPKRDRGPPSTQIPRGDRDDVQNEPTENEHGIDDSSDDILLGAPETSTPLHTVNNQPPPHITKKDRESTTPQDRNPTFGAPIVNVPLQGKKRKRPSPSSAPTSPQTPFLEITTLIDTALRLSISKTTPKLAPGIKLLTNTFTGTLSEICPSLFTPQYLPALSQRSHFLSTITRSLSRGSSNAKSPSLKRKIARLGEPTTAHTELRTAKSIHARLWLYVQRRLAERPAKPLEAFCLSEMQLVSGVEEDDILDETRMRDEGGGFAVFAEDGDDVMLGQDVLQTPGVSLEDMAGDQGFEMEKGEDDDDDLLHAVASTTEHMTHPDSIDQRHFQYADSHCGDCGETLFEVSAMESGVRDKDEMLLCTANGTADAAAMRDEVWAPAAQEWHLDVI